MVHPLEKRDNSTFFELIFELDKRLQSSQSRQSPLSNLLGTFQYLEMILPQIPSDTTDTIYLKLIDFFTKCNCNYKRFELSKFIQKSSDQLVLLQEVSTNNSIEALKRISVLWDQSFNSDFETCNQILNLLKASSTLFYYQPSAYAIFFESFTIDHLDSSILISVTLNYLEILFSALKKESLNLVNSAFIENSNFSARIIQTSNISKYFNDPIFRFDSFKITLIASVITGDHKIIGQIPDDIKLELKELIRYL